MKKLLLMAVILMTLFTGCGKVDTTYPLTTKVVDINYFSDVVTVMDFNGMTWKFTGTDDWMVGDICSMIMDSRGTELVFDDVIIDYKYDGYIE